MPNFEELYYRLFVAMAAAVEAMYLATEGE